MRGALALFVVVVALGRGFARHSAATIGNGNNVDNAVTLKIGDVVNEQFVTFSFTELASGDGGVGVTS